MEGMEANTEGFHAARQPRARAGRHMVRQLIVTGGKDRGRGFMLPDEGTLPLGREGSAGTRLYDLAVSRRHCEVRVTAGRVIVVDCNSSGGTFVNDRPVKSQELEPGDVIRLGNTELRL